ncbi:hypothetical protein SPONL_739 [uncultured Candidatus Thioglobus sp.]|nr:hypothetical protein SPONL_739 [uncultured Candidatus Thioglobus sp.]
MLALNFLEEKNNSIAFVLMTIAAMFWGMFGLVSAFATSITTSSIFFVTLGTLFSLLLSVFSCLSLKISIRGLLQEVVSNKELRNLVIIRAISGLSTLAIVAGFFLLSNKIVGLLIFESAPMVAVLISHYILKKHLDSSDNTAYTWLLIFFSFFGVVILLLEVNNYPGGIFAIENRNDLLGLLIVFVGLIGNAVMKTYGPKIAILMREIDPGKRNIEYALASQLVPSLILFILMAILTVFFYTPTEIKLFFNTDYFLLLALAFGFIEFIVSFIGRVALQIATSHNIYITWFLTPLIGIFLLSGFGYGDITPAIILSLILILVPNLLLNIQFEKSLSFKVTLIWILLFATIVFYSQGIGINAETYFNSTNALLVFFALMIGYALTKINARIDFREQLFMRFLCKVKEDGFNQDVISKISTAFQQSNSRLTNTVEKVLIGQGIDIDKYGELDNFKFIKSRNLYNIGELFVLFLISLLLLGITIFYRENNFLYDTYAFIINTAVIFTLVQVLERIFFNEYSENVKIYNILIDTIIGIVFLIVLTVSIVFLFLIKHNYSLY